MDDTVTIGLLRGMLEIPSPSYHEAELAGFLATTARRLGLDASVDAAGNLVAVRDCGKGPSVLLLGHLDTVPGHVPVRSADGRLYGRGAVDAKGPLAAMLCAAAGVTGFRGRVTVVGAVEEETPWSRGAMHVRATAERPDYVVVGEPSGWSTVVLGYKGKLDLRYQVHCAPTHPSNPVRKASEWAAVAWHALQAELGPEADHGSFDRPGATLVSIDGDTADARAELSVRTPVGFDSAGLVERVRAHLPEGELTVLNQVEACRMNRRTEVVRALAAGIRTQNGTPAMKTKTGTSDMNTLAEVWDVPMATYGPGDSALDHADDEHILVADYFRGVAVLTKALCELSGTAGEPGRALRAVR